jgi:hypothetical protein
MHGSKSGLIPRGFQRNNHLGLAGGPPAALTGLGSSDIVLGYPQETPETIQNTLEVCQECSIFPN